VSERIGDYLDQFVQRCKAERSVHGVLLLGSAASPTALDELSDLDLMVITTSPRRLSSPAWLGSIAPALISWTYQSPVGGQRVGQAIYDGPLVVDLAFVSSIQAALLGMAVSGLARRPALRRRLPRTATSQMDAWLAITARGTKVLFDRVGLARRIAAPVLQGPHELPREADYLNTVYSALGLILWESKQLVRGELWMALETVDHQVKKCLLTMIEWHSIAVNPELNDSWYGGRHIQDWADARWSASLRHAWSRFDVSEAWDALFATLDLLSDVATETARVLGYRYPADEELRVRGWVEARHADSRKE
jgi:hypothetical protein